MVVESGTARYLKVSRGGRIIICSHRPGFESGADPRDDGALAVLGIFWIPILGIEKKKDISMFIPIWKKRQLPAINGYSCISTHKFKPLLKNLNKAA